MAENSETGKKKGTRTRSFGSSARESHDASDFYNSRMYSGIDEKLKKVKYVENPVPGDIINTIINKSSEKMGDLPDSSVHLMVTSPPYNVSKDYDEDLSLDEYMVMLKRVFSETWRVLVPGGRACINIANIGRKPYMPLHAYIIRDMLEIGFYMRGEIIWNKSASAGVSTAWGSWQSASNPCLRDVHEYIMVFCKETFKRKPPEKRENTIEKDDFVQWTKSIWDFSAASARKIGHPAPFPEELPHRLIQLYTFRGETVLDPFCGSGSTCIAAINDGRNYIGYEINPDYAELAEKRIGEYRKTVEQLTLFDK